MYILVVLFYNVFKIIIMTISYAITLRFAEENAPCNAFLVLFELKDNNSKTAGDEYESALQGSQHVM